MTREDFIKDITAKVQLYIDNFDRFDSNPQLRINPFNLHSELVNGSDLYAEIEDSDEAVENASAAVGGASEEYTDYQVKQNPDFYPVKKLLQATKDSDVPSGVAIARIADIYFKD